VVDEQGEAVPLERALLLPSPVFLQGVIYPAVPAEAASGGKGRSNGAQARGAAANKEQARRVKDRFGPLTAWRVAYSKQGMQVCACGLLHVYCVLCCVRRMYCVLRSHCIHEQPGLFLVGYYMEDTSHSKCLALFLSRLPDCTLQTGN
jgi:hypothetical protein